MMDIIHLISNKVKAAILVPLLRVTDFFFCEGRSGGFLCCSSPVLGVTFFVAIL